MTQFDNGLYSGNLQTVGRRDGAFSASDGLSTTGSAGTGANPRRRLTAGWSDSFIGAMARAAGELKIALPAGAADDVEIDLCFRGGELFLLGRHNVSLPGLGSEIAWTLIDAAHQISDAQAAGRNIIVEINLV
jgi:lipoyl-dependent peroxiredoxin